MQELNLKTQEVSNLDKFISDLKNSYFPIDDFDELEYILREYFMKFNDKQFLFEKLFEYFYKELNIPVCLLRIRKVCGIKRIKLYLLDDKTTRKIILNFRTTLKNYNKDTKMFYDFDIHHIMIQIKFFIKFLKNINHPTYIPYIFPLVLYINGVKLSELRKILLIDYDITRNIQSLIRIIKEKNIKFNFYINNELLFRNINIELYYRLSTMLRIVNIASNEVRISYDEKKELIELFKSFIKKYKIDHARFITMAVYILYNYLNGKGRLFNMDRLHELMKSCFYEKIDKNYKFLLEKYPDIYEQPHVPNDNKHYLNEVLENIKYFAQGFDKNLIDNFITVVRELSMKSEYIKDDVRLRAFLNDVKKIMYYVSKNGIEIKINNKKLIFENNEKLYNFIVENIEKIIGKC